MGKKSGNDCNCSLMKTSWSAWNENTCKFPWGIKKQKQSPKPKIPDETTREGKWLLYFHKNQVNKAWDKIQKAVAEGKLWRSSISKINPQRPEEFREIAVYTKDYTHVNDVIRALDYLESLGIKPRDASIMYDKSIKPRSEFRKWLYSSDSIRSVGSSSQHVYEVNVNTGKLVKDCILCPSVTLESDSMELHARNNKYSKKKIDSKNQGKWILILPKSSVDAAWNKIKIAVKSGKLWRCSVSTTDPESPKQTYRMLIFTKDCTNVDDVIRVLNHLEECGIKSPFINIIYTSGGSCSGDVPKQCIYTSDTIRRFGSMQPRGKDYSSKSVWSMGRHH